MTTATYSPPQKPIDSTLLRRPEVEARVVYVKLCNFRFMAEGVIG